MDKAVAPSWSLGSGPGSPVYRLYDWLRSGVSGRLVGLMADRGIRIGRVLEAGSGPGHATSLFARRAGVTISVALDLDRDALQEGKRGEPALVAVRGDLYRLPFADASFDLVWSSSTVEHLDERHRVLAEMARVCSPGGHIFVGVPSRYGPLGFQPLIADTAAGVWLGPVFSLPELAGELTAVGLRPVGRFRYFLGSFIGVLAAKERTRP